MIDETGANLGVLPTKEALARAKEKGVDLIEIAPNAQPPVARLMEYGKFLYDQERQEKKRRAKERKDVMKTIRLTFGMSTHDMAIRVKKAEEFLKESSRLQIEVVLRGRQKAHPEVGRKKVEEFMRMLPATMKVLAEEKTPRGFQLILGKA